MPLLRDALACACGCFKATSSSLENVSLLLPRVVLRVVKQDQVLSSESCDVNTPTCWSRNAISQSELRAVSRPPGGYARPMLSECDDITAASDELPICANPSSIERRERCLSLRLCEINCPLTDGGLRVVFSSRGPVGAKFGADDVATLRAATAATRCAADSEWFDLLKDASSATICCATRSRRALRLVVSRYSASSACLRASVTSCSR